MPTDPSVTALFSQWKKPLVRSALEGHMGSVITTTSGRSARADIGSFSFFAGDVSKELVASCKSDLLVPCTPSWEVAMPRWLKVEGGAEQEEKEEKECLSEPEDAAKRATSAYVRIYRYPMHAPPGSFNEEALQAIVDNLASGYQLLMLPTCGADRDEEGSRWYHAMLGAPWSSSFCGNFSSCDDYLTRGRSALILAPHTEEGAAASRIAVDVEVAAVSCGPHRLVSGASSYVVFDGGIEVEVATDPAFSRQGLALVSSAALILSCLRDGLYPSWDAHSRVSAHMASKLGYRSDGAPPYVAYVRSDNTELVDSAGLQ